LASGVLVLGVGKATKLLENFIKCEKRYRATGKFGIETQSGDLGSPVVREGVPFTHISLSQFNNTLRKYTGVIDQIPPMYRFHSELYVKRKLNAFVFAV
jgi:tRNA pseudouridine55 synthase